MRLASSGCLLAAFTMGAWADNPAATITVDVGANRHAISPFIYGANWADQTTVSNLNLTANRRGGNATSNYNWQVNATNHAADWYFESLTDSDGSTPSAGPDAFITATKAAGGEPMITIPLMDWIAKLGANRAGLSSFSIAKYGAQTSSDPWFTDAGNGVKASDGTNITGNDPNDAYVPNSSSIQQAWVQHLVSKFGSSNGSGVKFYIMDNEHGVWPAEHRDLMIQGLTMETIRDKIIDYAGKVKAVDPSAQIVGPEEWGWPNYFLSSYDTSVAGNT
ncbi:MAG TPA: glycoside hydrolase family 44 protein, partial [Chthoniobacterales bacterium]